MSTTEKMQMPCPFDGSVHARQIRMGLLNSLGVPDQDVIAVLSRVYAAIFYDYLWDTLGDGEQVSLYCKQIGNLQKEEDFRYVFHIILSLYESLCIPLPEPAERMMECPNLEASFAAGFIRRIDEFHNIWADG